MDKTLRFIQSVLKNWWSGTRNIRTRDCCRVLPGNIEREYDSSAFVSIVIDVDRVHQSVNYSAPILYIIYIAALEGK